MPDLDIIEFLIQGAPPPWDSNTRLMVFKDSPIIVIQAVVAAAILAGLNNLFMLKSGTLTEGASMEFLPHRHPPES